MKILAFTDTHTDKAVLKELDSKVKEADLLICSGDIAWLGSGAKEVIDHFEKWKKKLLLIHGNHEFEEEINVFCKNKQFVEFLHKKIKIINDVMFIGYGGDWYHQTNPDFEEWVQKNSEKIISHVGKKILVVHMPVYNTKTDFLHGAHRGNISYKNFVKKFSPDFVFHGHFHETFHLKDKINNTLVVNPGQDGEFYEL